MDDRHLPNCPSSGRASPEVYSEEKYFPGRNAPAVPTRSAHRRARLTIRLAAVGSLWFALLAPTAGCNKVYYQAMDAIGREKRDILVSRVDNARDAQEDAKEEFTSALERFSALIDFDGGKLETLYRDLEKSYESSSARANEVRETNDRVERVAEDLFDEWEDELEQYTDPELRRRSQRQLRDTRARLVELVRVMRRAEQRMDRVLGALRDQVLYLKHNLNAAAVGSLESRAAALRTDIDSLIAEMNASIQEARRFADELTGQRVSRFDAACGGDFDPELSTRVTTRSAIFESNLAERRSDEKD